MPYEIRALKWNRSIHIQVEQGGVEKTVAIRNKETTTSDVVTPDMRTQKAMGYVSWAFSDGKEAPSEEKKPELPKYYTEEELKKMKKAQLKELVEKHPGTEVDPDSNKDVLLEGLLKFDIPRE